MKTLILILISTFAFGQKAKLQTTIGIHYTGGFQYDMEHEPMSAQLGLIYTLKNNKLPISNIGISGNYYYDFIPEKPNGENDFYVLRFQLAKEVIDYWNITSYAGYINSFDNNYIKSFKGEYRSNFAYGIGLQHTDDYVTAELMYERLAGYPHLSVGVNVNLINFFKK